VNAPLKLPLGEPKAVGMAKKLIASGKISHDAFTVICVTGNGLKTFDAVKGRCGKPHEIKPSPLEFEALPAHGKK
jgi:threonine synthase